MEVLDTSIANVALPHIAGNLGASNDESTWVLTSYLVSNAIVLPISGWLATLFGRKRFFLLCIFLFTLSSLLCGAAPTLGTLILFRVLQGAGGGGLQPMAQAILADMFPPQKRGLAFALYGITAIMAPTIGPTLGGWITDNYSWRWIFYINLPVGVLTLFLVMRMVEDPPYLARTKGAGVRVDYIGIALLALGIGALQILLDKGQEDDWFGSHFIVSLAAISAVCLISLVFWEWRQKAPIIDVHMFRSFNFAVSSLMMFILGVLLFSSLVMMPQFLQTLLGYTAESAGLVLSGASLVILFQMPIVGQLTTKIPAKYIMAFGWLCLAAGMYYSTMRMDLQISFASAAWLRVAQSFGLGFLFVPINSRGVHRSRARKRQQRIRADQLHAQHRQQRGNVHGYHAAGAARSISPVRAGISCDQLRSGVSQSDPGRKPAAGPRGSHRSGCAGAGLWTGLSVGSGAIANPRLYRHVHDSRGRGGYHVRVGFHREEERPGLRRRSRRRMMRTHP